MKVGRHAKYNDVLRIPVGRRGRFAIKHVTREPNFAFPVATARTAVFAGHQDGTVSYPHETRWHVLTEGRHAIWMTDYPIEQAQCDAAIKPMHGRVLVGGLGLGYAVTALAAKRAVREIVVIEKSQHVADLVWRHLGPEVRARATLIVMDLFSYLRSHGQGRGYEWGFYDIWQSDGEGTFFDLVVPLRRLSYGKVQRVVCWNEDVMRGQLFGSLLGRLALADDAAQRPTAWADTGGVWTAWFQPFRAAIDARNLWTNRRACQVLAARYAAMYEIGPNWLATWETEVVRCLRY